MIKNPLLNDKFIVLLILINALVLFADSFPRIQFLYPWLDLLDVVITSIFLLEMIFKIKAYSFKGYLKDNWNRVDFIINLILVPSFVLIFLGEKNFFFLTVLRLVRLTKFFRFLRFVPNIDHLITGLKRALKASVFIFIVLFLYLFIISILSCFFFKEVSPEHFGDPLRSLYSTFKIFTIEGWYELPELIANQYGLLAAFGVKLYFIFLVLTGGVFGIGLVNAVFVDELVADNNDEVLKKLEEISREIKSLKEKKEKD